MGALVASRHEPIYEMIASDFLADDDRDAMAFKFLAENTTDRSKLIGSHGQRPWV